MSQSNISHYKNVLLVRFSALGDVAMTVPVIYSLAQSYPDIHFTMLSNIRFAPMFANMPQNFSFMGVDIKRDYHGMGAMFKLYSQLKAYHFDAVANLHGVLRTNSLGLLYRLSFVKVARINKERSSRKRLIRMKHKDLTPMHTSFERYSNVLERLGFKFKIEFTSIFGTQKGDLESISYIGSKECPWIGIAPFAAHKGKIYPLNLMEEVVAKLDASVKCRQFVFAYGSERDLVAQWADKYNSVELIDTRLGMEGELNLMSHINVMLAMDSGNMHLASLVGTPVVSIWGATHPAAGFMGYGQKPENCIQLNIPCRPCSIYGKKECVYSDYRCMTGIKPDIIFAQVKGYLE